MRRRLRKLIGASVMLFYLPVYTVLAVALAQARPVQSAPRPIQMLCLAGLGIIWIAPLLPLVRWMQKPDTLG